MSNTRNIFAALAALALCLLAAPRGLGAPADGLGQRPYQGWSSWSLEATKYPGYGGMGWLTARHVEEQSGSLTLLLCGTALAGTLSICVNAAPQASCPVKIQVSVDGSSTMLLGEPLSLHYRMTNVSADQGVGVGLGTNGTQWYSLSLTDASGKSAQIVPDDRPLNPRGLHSTGTYFLPPNGYQEDHIVVTRFFRFLHSGKYTLTVKSHVAYATEVATEETSLDSSLGQDIRSSGKTSTGEFVFPVTVSESDPVRLETRSTALREAATAEKHGQKYRALLDALFSMPETQAARDWEILASGAGRMDSEVIADELSQVHSARATTLLVQMLDNPNITADEKSYIKTKINETYNSGDSQLRANIKSIAASRGIKMPEHVAMPQVVD